MAFAQTRGVCRRQSRPCRGSAHAGRRLHVRPQRRHGQMAGRELFGRAGRADPLGRRLHHSRPDDRAARRARTVRHRAAVAAVLAGGVRDGRHRAVLRRRRLSAAGRRHDLLHGRSDLRRGAVASAARREGRLAALAGDPDRFRRRRHRAAPVDGVAVAVVVVRAGRQRIVRHDD